MTYQVLARKWRPKSFEDVVGQEHVVKALQNSLVQNKIHQAYLLTGTRGVGKTTIARILTKCLNCEEGLSANPCLSCSSCKSISEGSFMDFHEVDAASRRGVEETQQLLETVMHVPGSSRYKVYLIDEVHMLSKHSFNALLKTLEEPPPHIVFILATTEPEKVLPTVISRCLQFNLKNLTPSQLTERLDHILKEEKVEFESQSIEFIARAGRGSLRDCLTLADQAIAFSNGQLTADKVSEMLGTLPFDHVFSLLNNIIEKDSKNLLSKLREISELSVDYPRLMDLILEALQYIAVAHISPEALSESNIDKEGILKLAKTINAEDTQVLYQVGLLAKRDIDLAPDQIGGFEMALLRMLAFMPESLVEESKKKITEKEVQPTPKDLDKDSGLTNDKLSKNYGDLINKENWNSVFKSLELDLGTKQLISHCSLLRVEDSTIYFSIPEDKLEILNGTHREKFQNSLNNYLSIEANIFFEKDNDSDLSPNNIKKKKKSKKIAKAVKSLEKDKNLQLILDDLEGEVITGSVKPKSKGNI